MHDLSLPLLPCEIGTISFILQAGTVSSEVKGIHEKSHNQPFRTAETGTQTFFPAKHVSLLNILFSACFPKNLSELMMVDIYVSGYYVPRTELSLLPSCQRTFIEQVLFRFPFQS